MNTQQYIDFILKPEILNKETIPLLQDVIKEFPYCHSAHLLLSKNLYNENDIKYDNQLKIAAAYAPDRKKLSYLILKASTKSTGISEKEKKEEPNTDNQTKLPIISDEIESKAITSVETKNNLIDKFLVDQPSMPRPKQEFFNPANLAEQSGIDDSEIISETLALIFLKQNQILKAIQTYEKLCLKFPEKNTYFARQIEKIKNSK